MNIELKPIAFVTNLRTEIEDDNWSLTISEIELADDIPTETFDNIEDFSHLEIIYYFNKVDFSKIIYSGHPRENKSYPRVGIFAQRKKERPNKLGLCNVELLEHNGRKIKVKYLDAIDGTPVLDIKPIMKEFQIKSEIKQPNWSKDLMKNYW